MDDQENIQHESAEPAPGQPPRPVNAWLLIGVVLLCATLVGLGYGFHERQLASRLASDRQQMSAALDQTRSQLDALAQKVDSLTAAKPAEPVAAPPAETTEVSRYQQAPPVAARHRPRKAKAGESSSWTKLQARLDAQQKQLEATQQDVAKTRSDLEGELGSTRDDLGNTIARNHDELVVLERRGERNYFEFDLYKSKQFARVGPVSLSLRKANTKKQNFDIAMLVDDNTLEKKHVNLYEPLVTYPEGSHRSLELVVNHISKNQVHGYVSAPKYSEQETAASNTAAGASIAPAADAQAKAPADNTPALERRPSN